MSKVSVSIEGSRYFVDDELAIRANAFRLPDKRVLSVKVWSFGNLSKISQAELTTSAALWAKLPTLEVDSGLPKTPRFLINHMGREYVARTTPWSFARTPDTGKVLYILWREAEQGEVNPFIPFEISVLYYHEQLFELLPLAVPA